MTEVGSRFQSATHTVACAHQPQMPVGHLMQAPEKFSILLVDDDCTVVRILSHILRDFGPLRFATSGRLALKLARESVPDLVIRPFAVGYWTRRRHAQVRYCAETAADELSTLQRSQCRGIEAARQSCTRPAIDQV